MIEMGACAGIILSPLVGAVLFSIGGFCLSFYAFGLLYIIAGLLCSNALPSHVDGGNKSSEELNETFEECEEAPEGKDLSYDEDFYKQSVRRKKLNLWTLLRKAETAFPTFLAFVNYLSFVVVEPTIALRLTKNFNFTQTDVNLFCTALVIGSVIGTLMIQYQQTKMDFKVMIVLACLLNGLSFLFIGPCEILPQKYQLMVIGELMAGYSMAY